MARTRFPLLITTLLTAFLFSSLALLPGTAHAAELSAAERSGLIQQLRDLHTREPGFQAEFTEQRNSRLLNKPIINEGTVWFQAPDKFRREMRGSRASLTVSNGKIMWIYYPNFKEAELYSLGQRAMFDNSLAALMAGLNFRGLEEHYNVRAFRDDGGNFRLDLVPKRQNLRRIVERLIVILDADFRPQRTELTLPKGDRLVTTYRNVRRPALDRKTFEFSPPPDARVSRPLGG